MFLGQGAPSIPLWMIFFFCLEWLKVKPSALNLSQALLFRKSGNPNKQTKNKSCPEMVARQHSRRQEQEKTSDRFCRRLAIKKIKSRHFILWGPFNMSDDQSRRFYMPFPSSPPLSSSILCKLLNTFNSIWAFSAALSFCELPTLLNWGSYVWLQNNTVKARMGPLWFVI